MGTHAVEARVGHKDTYVERRWWNTTSIKSGRATEKLYMGQNYDNVILKGFALRNPFYPKPIVS
jgi:hypothetical protein